MLAEAFVSAGCTYCDKDDVTEFLSEQQPDLLVLRRSLPHAGEWPDTHEICKLLERSAYSVSVIAIIRDSFSAYHSVCNRREDNNPAFQKAALEHIGRILARFPGRYISYEYFVLSQPYRKHFFANYGLGEPEMEFYDGNAKYYE